MIEEKKEDKTFDVTIEHNLDSTNVSSLRRVAEGIPFAAWFILVNEFW